MDTHLEVGGELVSDVDRAKAFYSMLGWRLDADVSGDEYRLVQFTRPARRARSSSARTSRQYRPDQPTGCC
jgi:predicted enzyme related to lactoylglutathione lyase